MLCPNLDPFLWHLDGDAWPMHDLGFRVSRRSSSSSRWPKRHMTPAASTAHAGACSRISFACERSARGGVCAPLCGPSARAAAQEPCCLDKLRTRVLSLCDQQSCNFLLLCHRVYLCVWQGCGTCVHTCKGRLGGHVLMGTCCSHGPHGAISADEHLCV